MKRTFYLWSTGFSLPCSQSHYDYILVLMERNKTKTAKEFIDWRITHIHTYVTENTKVREWLQLHLNPPSIQRRTIVCCRCKIPEKPWTFTVSFLNAMLALLLMTWGNVKTQHRPACIIRAFRAAMGLISISTTHWSYAMFTQVQVVVISRLFQSAPQKCGSNSYRSAWEPKGWANQMGTKSDTAMANLVCNNGRSAEKPADPSHQQTGVCAVFRPFRKQVCAETFSQKKKGGV